MEKQECINVISIINEYLSQNLWMDFEAYTLNYGDLILGGKIDIMYNDVIEITFIEPFFVSMAMCFTYEEGAFVELINSDEFVENDKKYRVEEGNWQFRITPEPDLEYLVIAKGITVKFNE